MLSKTGSHLGLGVERGGASSSFRLAVVLGTSPVRVFRWSMVGLALVSTEGSFAKLLPTKYSLGWREPRKYGHLSFHDRWPL